MQSDSFVDSAVSVAAVAAVAGLLYARASARSARQAADTARRSMEVAERSRQAAARARLRGRVERVGELVQALAASSNADADELSSRTTSQCRVLHRAVNGLADILPKTAEVSRARSPVELSDRVSVASREIDALLKKLSIHRQHSAYRPRHQVPWHRPTGVRS
jgi:uncharacterized membrane protein YccC